MHGACRDDINGYDLCLRLRLKVAQTDGVNGSGLDVVGFSYLRAVAVFVGTAATASPDGSGRTATRTGTTARPAPARTPAPASTSSTASCASVAKASEVSGDRQQHVELLSGIVPKLTSCLTPRPPWPLPLHPFIRPSRQPLPGERQRVCVQPLPEQGHVRGRRGQLHLPVRAALQRAHLRRGPHPLLPQPLRQQRRLQAHGRLPGLPVQVPGGLAG